VDDEAALRPLVATALKSQGYLVLVAESGSAALALEAEYPGTIRGLLTDVVMPGMDGPTLARRLLARRPKLRVSFMSGYTATHLGEALEEWSGAEVLEKPFKLASLLEAAEKLMRTS
jgi:two-component system cell cycle sensor histidine kinase/response regulator CckA